LKLQFELYIFSAVFKRRMASFFLSAKFVTFENHNLKLMNRRNFLHYTGLATIASTGIISPGTLLATNPFPASDSFQMLVKNLIALNDQQVQEIIDLQDKNPHSKYYGGVCDSWKIYNAGSTAGLVKTIACSFSQPESEYYLDDSLTEPVELALKYLLKIQHTDGTIDLLSTNFHSTPDTAFVVEPLWFSYHLFKQGNYRRQESILQLLKKFMLNAGEAFVVGGVHTPNHRWVVSMALSLLHHSFPDERYENRISEWLQEGVDIDEDGQYEERSTYIYTPLTNRCLLNIAMYNNRPELWDIIEKNLEMMLYYVHPNGEVATEASGRQDQFKVGFMEHYYVPYRMAALHKNGHPQFEAMVDLIEKTVPEKLLTYLPYFLILPSIGNEIQRKSGEKIPDNYVKEFPGSNLVRIRRGNIDATILGNNPTFLTVSKGKAVLASVRMASAFFGKGQFKSRNIEKEGDTFKLKWEYHWGYFQPLPENQKPNYHIPFDEDRKRRPMSERQDLYAEISVAEKNGKFHLNFDVKGTDNVPLAIEFAFRNGGKLSGVEIPSALTEAENAGTFLLKEGTGNYRFEQDSIELNPGLAEHEWTAIRGALPKPDTDCVYITDFTPFKKEVTIG